MPGSSHILVTSFLVFFGHLKVRQSRNVFFLAEDSSKKQTKTRGILVKTNSFVRFLEESSAWQFAFEINWPLIYTLFFALLDDFAKTFNVVY